MGRLKATLLSLDIIILLFLAAGGSYYWANRQLAQKVPSCPLCPPAKTAPAATSSLISSDIIDWLEGTTPQMISYNDWCLGIDGEMQSLTENTLRIQKDGVSKEFAFSEGQPITYQKWVIETEQATPISKEEIKVGDAIRLEVCFNVSTGGITSLRLNKFISEEETASPTP